METRLRIEALITGILNVLESRQVRGFVYTPTATIADKLGEKSSARVLRQLRKLEALGKVEGRKSHRWEGCRGYATHYFGGAASRKVTFFEWRLS